MAEINWDLVAPIIVSVGANALMLAYLVGGIRSKIDSLSTRIDRLEMEHEKDKDMNHRLGEQVHGVALVVTRIETQLSGLMDRVEKLCSESGECPFAKGGVVTVPRRKRKVETASIEAP